MGCEEDIVKLKERGMGKQMRTYWQRFLDVLDYCIWKHPFTFMLIPWIIHDLKSVVWVVISCFLDYLLPRVAINVFDYRFYRNLKKDVNLSLSGHLTVFESDLVAFFRNAATKCFKPFWHPLDVSIRVFFSDKMESSSTAFPSASYGSIILLRELLKDKANKAKCYYQLAHELGHVQHFYNGSKYSLLPVVTTVLELLLVCHVAFNMANSQLGIIFMVCMFNINSVISMIYIKELIFKNEFEADLVGLNIIKKELGVEEMGNAASFYIKNRINNVRTLKNRKQFSLNRYKRKAELDCIEQLAWFVPQKEKEELIARSEKRSKLNEKEFDDNVIMASRKWSTERLIQEALKKSTESDYAPSPSDIIESGEQVMSLQYRTSAVATVVFITATLGSYTYTWGYQPVWSTLFLLLTFYSFNSLITLVICKKLKTLLEQIGN